MFEYLEYLKNNFHWASVVGVFFHPIVLISWNQGGTDLYIIGWNRFLSFFRIPSWNVLTKMSKNVITLMLRNSPPLKKRYAKRTLKKLVKSPSNNKLLKKPSKNVISPWSKFATDKAKIFVKPSTNQLVPPNTSRNNPVRFNEIYLILLTYTYFCFRFSRIPQLRLWCTRWFHEFFWIGNTFVIWDC